LKKQFEAVPPISLIAMPDKKGIIKSDVPAPAPEAAPAEEQPQPDPYARYRTAAPAQPTPQPAPVQAPAGPTIPKLSGEGTWTEGAGQYVLTVPDPTGKEQNVTATIRGDEMVVHTPIIPLVFFKE
jgi:hypothetical protein